MISEHSAHSTQLPVGFRAWLWRYTCLLLLISMLWHKHTYLPTYLHACMHACMHAYIHTYIHTYITYVRVRIYVHTYMHTYIHACLLSISMLWHRQAIFESKGNKLSSSECRIRTQMVSGIESPADWMPADKQIELSRIKLNTWTRQPVLIISEQSVHSTPLPLLLLISMLLHRQAIFKSRGDKLSSSDESKNRADWMPVDKPTELVRIKLKSLNSTARPYDQWAFRPRPFGIRTWVWRCRMHVCIH